MEPTIGDVWEAGEVRKDESGFGADFNGPQHNSIRLSQQNEGDQDRDSGGGPRRQKLAGCGTM